MADNGGTRRRTGRRWVLWIVAGIAAAGAVVAVLGIWHLPARMYPHAGDAEARAALQGGLLTAAAALMAVAGGLIALDETRQANANTHVRELYATAISQLGADSLDIRLGGIYALERIAHDSTADQRTVVEVLSAFVREHTGTGDPPPPRPTTDVQAALTVLGRLPHRRGIPRADLTGAHLVGANLIGANLTSAQLGGVNLARADLISANLSGARLTMANLTGALLHGANLTGAGLFAVNLTDARLPMADLTRAELVAANLTGAWELTAQQVAETRGDARTRLPDGVERPASWPPYDPVPGPSAGGS
ncbi:hypothetical protein CcI49_29970 [Frankia sp. CcI49]|uniref:pentapeptide repeat-containing protein n=1 Tax=Frankia sp. CcI49 TaxID=1745382 RepID=UPI00097695FF|nr:pentapeptide repeat-containing protein [Frankia sp. CcI49]ONH54595.1 hypothetical protein CcI49_29970 [Frankia sp. CcI49]